MKRPFPLLALLFAATFYYGAVPALAASLTPDQLAQAPNTSAVVKVGGYDGGYRRYDDQDDRSYSDDKSFRDPKDFSEEKTYREERTYREEKTYRERPAREESYSYSYKRYGGGYDGPHYRHYGHREYCWSCRHHCHDGFCPPHCWGRWRQCHWHGGY